jgi:hypothetical protein
VLTAVGLLIGLGTLLYPFGGDQGLYYYVGREWLAGAVPYRDAMEQKTPLVFLLHAALIALTGENQWAVRAAELAWLLVVGRCVATLATPQGESPRAGTLGVATLASSLFYFGFFGYWDTAQCEIWYAGLALLALRIGSRGTATRRRTRLGGACAGLALLMKPPAATLLAVVAGALAWRAADGAPAGRRARACGVTLLDFSVGLAIPVATMALYFAAAGALDDLVDQAILANYHDMRHSATAASPAELALRFTEFLAQTGVALPGALALALAGWRVGRAKGWAEPGARYGTGALLLGAGVAAVVAQRKFYGYHWGVLAPLMAWPLACWAHDLARWRPAVVPLRLRAWVAPVTLSGLALAAFLSGGTARSWGALQVRTWAYACGRLDRAAFLEVFVAEQNTPYVDHETVGLWLRARSAPHERVAVRGFDQVVYAVARRRAPTRFFWTRWLTEPRRAYRREQWLTEDREALLRDPPRYVVVNERARRGPASAAYFTALGYRACFRHGRLIVLERRSPQTRADPRLRRPPGGATGSAPSGAPHAATAPATRARPGRSA